MSPTVSHCRGHLYKNYPHISKNISLDIDLATKIRYNICTMKMVWTPSNIYTVTKRIRRSETVMKFLYRDVLHCAEKSQHRQMRSAIRDPKSPDYGKHILENGIHEPGVELAYIHKSVFLYVCPDSIYYRKPEVLDFIETTCFSAENTTHEDGTNDLVISNYHQAEFFATPSLCAAYKHMEALPQKTAREEEVTEIIYHITERICQGLLVSGFHTPNHRWVHTAALFHAYNTLREKDERYLILANKYLAEKIDIDENGEFSERSAGMYSAVSDRALCEIAIQANKPELFEHVKKNLLLVYKYIEKGNLIFTQNSRRKDKGEVGSSTLFDFDRYGDICLTAYAATSDPIFLQILASALNKRTSFNPPAFSFEVFLRYPQLTASDVDLSTIPSIDEDFHLFHPKTNVVRAKQNGAVYTILSKNPNFLHITAGNISVCARICSSFFAKAQFYSDSIEQVGKKQYRMTFHTDADYKRPFDTPPEGSENYWSMDYNSRESVCYCEYGYILDLGFTENGLDLHIQTTGMPNVPFKLEFATAPDVFVKAGTAMTQAQAGGFISASEGDIALCNFGGDQITFKGAFAKHFYHKAMRGSLPVSPSQYTVFFTDFSPVDRKISIVCENDLPWDYYSN